MYELYADVLESYVIDDIAEEGINKLPKSTAGNYKLEALYKVHEIVRNLNTTIQPLLNQGNIDSDKKLLSDLNTYVNMNTKIAKLCSKSCYKGIMDEKLIEDIQNDYKKLNPIKERIAESIVKGNRISAKDASRLMIEVNEINDAAVSLMNAKCCDNIDKNTLMMFTANSSTMCKIIEKAIFRKK